MSERKELTTEPTEITEAAKRGVLRIGIDFDNTIVCYEGLFYGVAREKGLLPDTVGQSKDSIRDYFRSIGKESIWTELQGYVYGTQMDRAHPFPGVEEFFLSRQATLFIISHKTRYPYLGPQYDLHEAAKKWLKNQPLAQNVTPFFELTLQEKLARIKTMECDYFIDDLPELLLEAEFPPNIQKILFDPSQRHKDNPQYIHCSSWKEVTGFFDKL